MKLNLQGHSIHQESIMRHRDNEISKLLLICVQGVKSCGPISKYAESLIEGERESVYLLVRSLVNHASTGNPNALD